MSRLLYFTILQIAAHLGIVVCLLLRTLLTLCNIGDHLLTCLDEFFLLLRTNRVQVCAALVHESSVFELRSQPVLGQLLSMLALQLVTLPLQVPALSVSQRPRPTQLSLYPLQLSIHTHIHTADIYPLQLSVHTNIHTCVQGSKWDGMISSSVKFTTESVSERILEIGQHLGKLWARLSCLVFLTVCA